MRQAGLITIKGNKKRVLLVDDHAAVRAGVEALLAREPDLEALPSVATPNGAIAALKLIAESHTAREIAEILVISEKTVERHRSNILEKLGGRDRVALTRYAIKRGLVEP